MPFTAQEIQDAGKVGLDYYLKNNPIDQIKQDLPLLKALMEKRKKFPGAKEHIVEQLRYRRQSNFQFYRGESTVTYNRRQSVEQALFPWRSAHDGLYLDEDRLAQNGITVDDDGPGRSTQAERIQLTNLLEEQSEILKDGYEEAMHQALWLDGSGTTDDLEGIDFLIPLNPTTGTVGNINRATAGNEWWRSNTNNVTAGAPVAATAIAANAIISTLEQMWKDCIRYGGQKPTNIYAGWNFIEAYRAELIATQQLQVNAGGAGASMLDAATDLSFRGVPITWVPQFDDNFAGADAPAVHWSNRVYMLNLNTIKLRPMDGQDMVTRKPPRPHDQYVMHWALTWKGGLTLNKSRCNAVAYV